ncbi:S8 family serine peptidase [Heliobacillus mobilis]|uniref:S8 family serine peptidase n=1 Tax=Heliobacterium mobile TaxID=28064 RepID=A0A6I3SLT8_HELMO|nr:S8 family serine peptidase [Heliobacterium mobile]MTV49602.1 S8 family serine peptidase [Heliobacterium mobile]
MRTLRRFVAGVLVGALIPTLLTPLEPALAAPAAERVEYQFLNDRVRDMIGVTPLSVADFITRGGLTGKNQIVAIADSGLDKGSMSDLHPDFQNQAGHPPKVIALRSWSGRPAADDPIGHGTHMAGIIAGSGAASDGKYKGVAPDASLYVQSILNPAGMIEVPSNMGSLFQPAYQAGARIHVNGWGAAGNSYSRSSASADEFVRSHPDFLVIFGAGNNGPAKGTLTNEANSKNALTVGASQGSRPGFDASGNDGGTTIALSSRGPAAGGRIKPELLAPGAAIIAPNSRLTSSNFPVNPLYTRMQGTSMAAAVTGGCAALLREYLQKEMHAPNSDPSAALIKALLINYADTKGHAPGWDGFGNIDMASTVLALKANEAGFIDDRQGVPDGGEKTYQIPVTTTTEPLKVTLAWSDPVANGEGDNDSRLTNDLDLTVTGPDKHTYQGNDFLNGNGPDRNNNVEQVYIPAPQPGTYTITVRGYRVRSAATSESTETKRQDFALAFGQPPQRGTTESLPAAPSPAHTRLLLNGKAAPYNALSVPPGADYYRLGPDIYMVSRLWRSGGIQWINDRGRQMLLEMNPNAREGGYRMEPGAKNSVNGEPVQNMDALPPGYEVSAWINPASQTIRSVDAQFKEIDGYLDSIDNIRHTIRVLKDNRTYNTADTVTTTYIVRQVGSGWTDIPFQMDSGLEQPMSGLPVRLLLSPITGEVMHMAIERPVIQGVADQIGIQDQTIRFENGETYHLFPGAQVKRNGSPSTVDAIRPGDHLVAVILPESKKIIALSAFSTVHWGRIVYYSPEQNLLHFVDRFNRLTTFHLNDSTKVYRWGLPAEKSSLSTGNWAWISLTQGTGAVQQIDVVEEGEEVQKRFQSFSPSDGTIQTEDGATYRLSPRTILTKNGYLIQPKDLQPGESLNMTSLLAPRGPILGTVEAVTTAASPRVAIKSFFAGNRFFITGTTTADAIYLYRQGGEVRDEIIPDNSGNFAWYFIPSVENNSIQLIALDRRRGGIKSLLVTIPEGHSTQFSDIEHHWAEDTVRLFASRGLISGYPDSTFRPDGPVNQLEAIVLVARSLGWENGDPRPAIGMEEIPSWARDSLSLATQQGIIEPQQLASLQKPMTQQDMMDLLSRCIEPGTLDLAGTAQRLWPSGYEPASPLTRAQVTTLLQALLNALAEERKAPPLEKQHQ